MHTIHGHAVELVACFSEGQRLVAVVDGTILRGEYAPISWADEERALAKLSILLKPKATEMVECDCGHECGAAMVMSASVGTSCPDCYDTLSD